MRTVEHASKVFSPRRLLLLLPLLLPLLLLLLLPLLAGCGSAGTGSVEAFKYRDPDIPESEHGAMVRALGDLAGTSLHERLQAERYFSTMGIALGARLVPYWEQLLGSSQGGTRLAATRLIIKFCGPRSAPLLVEFLESENDAVRRDAYRKLTLVSGREYGFDYAASPGERAKVLERIRADLASGGP